MNVELRPLAEIKPYEQNPRHNDQAVDAVAESIKRFGWRQPIVVDADGVIVCGHTRWKAAQKLGLTEVPVHIAADLTPAQAKAYRLMDNRSHQETAWDVDLLVIELVELQDHRLCCGFGGTFAVKFPEVSVAMGEDKLRAMAATGAEYFVANDAGCLLHLDGLIHRQGLPLKTLHLAELLEKQE